MSDDLMIDVGYMLRASKRLGHKEIVRRQCQSFILFIQQEGLLVKPLLDEGEKVSDDFMLMESDLTDLGVKYFDKIYLKWVGRIDKGADPDDASYLEKSLAKMK